MGMTPPNGEIGLMHIQCGRLFPWQICQFSVTFIVVIATVTSRQQVDSFQKQKIQTNEKCCACVCAMVQWLLVCLLRAHFDA